VKTTLIAGIVASLLLLGSTSMAAQHNEQAESAGLYKSHCAMCHGADGTGNTPMGKRLNLKDLASAEVQHMTDADFKQIIENGKGKMPAFKSKLKAEQVQDLVAYLRTLKK
jgi:mono/diheme cytochrome c family protein